MSLSQTIKMENGSLNLQKNLEKKKISVKKQKTTVNVKNKEEKMKRPLRDKDKKKTEYFLHNKLK